MNTIKVMVIPADLNQKVFITDVEPTFEAYCKVVPGWTEHTMLEFAPTIRRGLEHISVYLDEEGLFYPASEPKPDEIDRDRWLNQRVTYLIGHDNSRMGHWGGALVAGAPDEEGNETGVPYEMIDWAKRQGWM